MKHNQSLLFLLLLISKLVPAQGKFIIQPLHPTASDTINFSYEPADSNDTAALAAKIYSYYNHFYQVDIFRLAEQGCWSGEQYHKWKKQVFHTSLLSTVKL